MKKLKEKLYGILLNFFLFLDRIFSRSHNHASTDKIKQRNLKPSKPRKPMDKLIKKDKKKMDKMMDTLVKKDIPRDKKIKKCDMEIKKKK